MAQYEDSAFWYQTGREIDNSKPDVFYVVSTNIIKSYDEDGNEVEFATLNAEERAALDYELDDIALIMFDDSFNLFAPYYHQVTMNSVLFNDKDKQKEFLDIAQSEVNSAFDYYMDNLNNGRPFVLAGYSQGSHIVKGILRHMTDEQYFAMAAAYVMGGPITAKDLLEPHIVPACGADDLGVTISYNSVASLDACWDQLTSETIDCINPINWTKGEDPAQFIYQGDKGIVHVDTQSHMLIVEGIDPQKYYLPDWPFPLGNYHNAEIYFYAQSIRENALLRLSLLKNNR